MIGLPAPAYGPVFVSSWRGREEAALAVIDTAVREFTSSGEGVVLAFADYARAVLYNGLSRYEDALVAATATDALKAGGSPSTPRDSSSLSRQRPAPGSRACGRATRRLEEMTHASDTGWGAGLRARSQALLGRR